MPFFGGGSGKDEGWKELGTVAASGGETDLNLSGLEPYDEYRFSVYLKSFSSSNTNTLLTFNGDSGANYEYKHMEWDGGNTYDTGQTSIEVGRNDNSNPDHIVGTISNFESSSRSVCHFRCYSLNAFAVAMTTGIWNNTTERITEFNINHANGFANGSKMIILGRNYS